MQRRHFQRRCGRLPALTTVITLFYAVVFVTLVCLVYCIITLPRQTRMFMSDESSFSCPFPSPRYDMTTYDVTASDETFNCSLYLQSRSYSVREVTAEETSFPIAYAILFYTDIDLFETLLSTVYRPHNYHCIHVDSKVSDKTRRRIIRITSCLRHTFFSSEAYDVRWGTYSVLQAELICMQDLMNYTDWKYFINLSGHEMPLRTNRELVRILRAYNGSSDIISNTKVSKENGRLWTGRAWKDFDHPTKRMKPPPPHHLIVAKGEAHIVCSRAFAGFVVHDAIAADFLDWVKDVRIPDEHYFQSLNANRQLKIPGAHGGIDKSSSQVRYKLWMLPGSKHTCKGTVIRNICNFGLGDLPQLMRSSALFANKFSSGHVSAQICVKHWIHWKETKKQDSLDIYFYTKLPFVSDAFYP